MFNRLKNLQSAIPSEAVGLTPAYVPENESPFSFKDMLPSLEYPQEIYKVLRALYKLMLKVIQNERITPYELPISLLMLLRREDIPTNAREKYNAYISRSYNGLNGEEEREELKS